MCQNPIVSPQGVYMLAEERRKGVISMESGKSYDLRKRRKTGEPTVMIPSPASCVSGKVS